MKKNLLTTTLDNSNITTEYIDCGNIQDAKIVHVEIASANTGKGMKSAATAAAKGDVLLVQISPCPFYAQGGGQVGDTGTLTLATGDTYEVPSGQ